MCSCTLAATGGSPAGLPALGEPIKSARSTARSHSVSSESRRTAAQWPLLLSIDRNGGHLRNQSLRNSFLSKKSALYKEDRSGDCPFSFVFLRSIMDLTGSVLCMYYKSACERDQKYESLLLNRTGRYSSSAEAPGAALCVASAEASCRLRASSLRV